MIKRFWSSVVLMLFITSCNKSHDYVQSPRPPAEPGTDARTILLKEVLVERLPSPYFYFTYNDSGYATKIDFASQLSTWNVQYQNKRVNKMISGSFDTLYYDYQNSQVISIRHNSRFYHRQTWRYNFTYNNDGQLTQIVYWAFPDSASDSLLNRKVSLQYKDDGNLASYDDYRNLPDTGLILASKVTFSNYDQGINVDDFYLLKDFFDDPLYLPQVKLQKNNPQHIVMEGYVNDYVADYTYQYNSKNLPVRKTYNLLWTKGQYAGQQFTGNTTFSYW